LTIRRKVNPIKARALWCGLFSFMVTPFLTTSPKRSHPNGCAPRIRIERSNLMKKIITLSLALAAVLGAHVAMAEPYVNVTVGGEIKPGVYGRVEIGTNPPPVVYSPTPVVIQPVLVPGQVLAPAYVYAPPGHRKHWAKHCSKYNACGVPVYFVKVDGKGRVIPDKRGVGRHEEGDRNEHGHGHGHGRRD
jgi:hypothetical protein